MQHIMLDATNPKRIQQRLSFHLQERIGLKASQRTAKVHHPTLGERSDFYLTIQNLD